MKTEILVSSLAVALLVATARAADTSAAPKENVFETKPLGIKLSIKMVGPYMQAADLQIILGSSSVNWARHFFSPPPKVPFPQRGSW